MEKVSWFKHIVAGVFFTVGICLFAGVVLVIGLDRGMVQSKFQAIVLFHDVSGLIEGAPIRISGVRVGIVKAVEFLDTTIEGRSLKVALDIFKKYELQFRKCSRVGIKTEGVLGQKFISISEDHSRRVFDVTRPIIGEDPLDVEDMAGVIARTAVSIQTTSDGVGQMMKEWNTFTRKGKRIMNRVEDKLNDGTLFKIF